MAKPVFATNDVPTAAQVNDWFVNGNFVRKTIFEDRTSTIALADDNALSYAIVAGAVYVWELNLNYDGSTASGITIGFTMPAGTSIGYTVMGAFSTAVGYNDDQTAAFTSADTPSFGAHGVGNRSGLLCRGLLTAGGTGGTFQFRWAQRVSNATRTRVFPLSYLDLRRVE